MEIIPHVTFWKAVPVYAKVGQKSRSYKKVGHTGAILHIHVIREKRQVNKGHSAFRGKGHTQCYILEGCTCIRKRRSENRSYRGHSSYSRHQGKETGQQGS